MIYLASPYLLPCFAFLYLHTHTACLLPTAYYRLPIAAPKSNTKIPSIFLFAFFLQCVCARQYWHAITFRTDSTARGPYAMNPPVVCCHRACNLQLPTAVPSCRFGTALSTVGSCTAPRASRHGGLSAITKTQSVRLLPLTLANPFGMRQSMLARGESKRL